MRLMYALLQSSISPALFIVFVGAALYAPAQQRSGLPPDRSQSSGTSAGAGEADGHIDIRISVFSLRKGVDLLNKGHYEKAIQEFDTILINNPNCQSAYVWRALAWSKRNEWDKAIADLDKAIDLMPWDATAYGRRAGCHMQKNEFKAAVDDFNKEIEYATSPNSNTPELIGAFLNRGYAWYCQKEYDRSIKDCNESLRLLEANYPNKLILSSHQNPELKYKLAYANAYGYRALSQMCKRDFKAAIEGFESAIALDPANRISYGGLAFIQSACPIARFRDPVGALKNATKLNEIDDSKDGTVLDILAMACAENSDYEKAARFEEKAIELYKNETSEESRQMRGRLELYRQRKPYRWN
jgi:tetratricopeptide (TPR) repeat protein